MRKLITVVTALAIWLTLGGTALALPSNAPDATAQTDGIVRAIAQAGNLIWVGGQFSHVKDANGTIVATVSDIAAFDATTGANATPSTVASLTGSGNIVYDLSFDPGTNTLYVGGLFTAGTAKNLVALDATTGAIKKSFSAPKLFSVLASGANVYGGGAALNAWVASTAKKLAGFTPPKAVIDASIRGHATAPIFRDLVAYGGSIVSACQCDSLTWSGTSYPTKALVRVDASTGQPQLWSSDGLYSPSGLKSDQANAAAFGISLYYDAPSDALYLAAGGSDFADRFVASTGAAVWHTDTSGSSQAITMFDGQVIDGGHFRWVARTKSQNCGDNANPNFGCIFQPRLVALDPATGVVTPAYTTETTSGGLTRYMERGWGPAICCAYNGTWAITPTSNGLWVGGEITTMGTGWNVNAAATAALPALKYVLDPSQHGGVGRFS